MGKHTKNPANNPQKGKEQITVKPASENQSGAGSADTKKEAKPQLRKLLKFKGVKNNVNR